MKNQTWKLAAKEMIPEVAPYLSEWDQPAGLWISIQGLMDSAINNNNTDLSNRIIGYLNWCVSGAAGDLSGDVQQAVYCGPLEDWGRNRKYWKHFPNWFSQAQFEEFFGSLSYGLSEAEESELRSEFYSAFQKQSYSRGYVK